MEEGIQRLREIGMLEWIYHGKPAHTALECPEDTPFTRTVRNKFVRLAPSSLKNSVDTLLCRSDITVGTAVTELESLNTMGIIGSRVSRSQVAAVNRHRQGGHGYHNGKQAQSSNQNNMTRRDLWCWLVDHGVPSSKIDGQSTKFLFELYKQKNSRSSEQKSNLNYKTESWPLNQFPDLRQFTDPQPLE